MSTLQALWAWFACGFLAVLFAVLVWSLRRRDLLEDQDDDFFAELLREKREHPEQWRGQLRGDIEGDR